MATLFMDGFDHYGVGNFGNETAGSPYAVMLEGVYGSLPTFSTAGLGVPAWGARTGVAAFYNASLDGNGLRYALPASKATFYVSFGFSFNILPPGNGNQVICDFRDGSNASIAALVLQSTGAAAIYSTVNDGATLLGATAGPVMNTGTWYQLNMEFVDSGNITVTLNGTEILTAGGYADTECAQLAMCWNQGGIDLTYAVLWMDDLFINDTSGTFSNSNPGDLQIATLLPNSDVVADQGWTANPRQLFGSGILDNTNNTSDTGGAPSIYTPVTSATHLGSGDFTMEGWFRFQALPTTTNWAHLLGVWPVGNPTLSYELALCGPSLNSGNIVWRISTDGTSATNIISYPFAPVLDQWYHIAVSRQSGVTSLYVGGEQQGLGVVDTNNYYAGTSGNFSIGAGAYNAPYASSDSPSWFQGWVEEVRATVGYSRYSASFVPPIAEFPVGSGADAHWSDVELLANFDSGIIGDLSQNAFTLSAEEGAVAITVDDGAAAWQVLAKAAPLDDTFIAGAMLPATSSYTQTSQPADGDTVTVATKDGSTAAVYRFKNTMSAAYDVQIGSSVQVTLANLVAAINAGSGSGTAYYAGTLVNNDVTAAQIPVNQIEVTADIAGTGGNSLATSASSAGLNGSWPGATLTGGTGLPSPSEFSIQHPPLNTTYILSVQLVTRQYKTDSGTCETQTSITGPGASVANGADYMPSTTPSYHYDVFDEDPDTSAQWTPTGVVGCTIGINRLE